MRIVADSGYDLSLEQIGDDKIDTLPLQLTLSGVSYRSGIDIQTEEFYQLLAETEDMPTTSVPSPGEFLELYQEVAAQDPDILSIHISSGLSGTFNSARTAAEQMKNANITLVDTRTLSGEMGWQIEAAIRSLKAGKNIQETLATMAQVRDVSEMVFTLPDLSYLIHGGRISHLKGLLASLLGIKPIIGVDKSDGKYKDLVKSRTFKNAIKAIPKYMSEKFNEGTTLLTQVGHAGNPEGSELLKKVVEAVFDCHWLPDLSISPVLGAHTGRGLVGLVFAPLASMPDYAK
jgi:DegV family protein with EDD domain